MCVPEKLYKSRFQEISLSLNAGGGGVDWKSKSSICCPSFQNVERCNSILINV